MKLIKNLILSLLVFTITLVISCQKPQLNGLRDEIESLEQINDILELKILINDARYSELLILELLDNDSSSSILLSFENGNNYEVPKEIILEYQIDSINWQLDLILADSSNVSTFILVNELTVKEINLNPFNITPLSSLITIETPIGGKFTTKVLGHDGTESDIVIKSDYYGTNHSLRVFGLYAGCINEVELTFTNKYGVVRTSTTVTIETDELPSGFPEFDIVKAYAHYEKNTLILVNHRVANIPFMVDPYGKVRWYSQGFTETRKYALQRFKNGNIGFGKGGDGQGSIFEYTMMGEFIKEYSFYPEFENAHHDVYEMSNGNFLVAVNKVGIETIEDHIIEMDRNSGTINNIWDLREILPMERYTLRKIGDGSDWFHVNAVIHDERDNTIIVSGQAQGLAKITWSNELRWILAPHEGWAEEYTDYLLEPTGGNFEWSWGQHAPLILPNGNLLQFDNGFGREFGQATSQYSRAVEYSISESEGNIGGSISQVWQYGKERGDDMFAPFISDVDFIENTSTRFIVAGSTAFDLSYLDSLNITLTPNTGQIGARIIEVSEAKEVLFEMTLSSIGNIGTTYRAEKIVIN
jgi:arylsulfate sulfotransferase